MPNAQIFISYRRDDAAGYARAVYDELARQFGAERVFMDVDDIGAGQMFDEVLRRAVVEAKVLLVLMGKRWQGEREGLPPRIADAGDFVRLEVAAGLAGGLQVIPLLLDGAPMPSAAQLPEELRPLVRHNALEIGNTRFAADVQRLVAALREALGEAPTEPASTPPNRIGWWLLAGALAAAALVMAWQWRSPAIGEGAAAPERAAANSARAAIDGEWQAEVNYDWPNARYTERFVFGGEAGELHGSASFLRVPRGVQEGSVDAAGLRFITRTDEVSGGTATPTVHRYRGTLAGDEIRFVMQTEGGSSAHVPVEFVARRVAAAAWGASR